MEANPEQLQAIRAGNLSNALNWYQFLIGEQSCMCSPPLLLFYLFDSSPESTVFDTNMASIAYGPTCVASAFARAANLACLVHRADIPASKSAYSRVKTRLAD